VCQCTPNNELHPTARLECSMNTAQHAYRARAEHHAEARERRVVLGVTKIALLDVVASIGHVRDRGRRPLGLGDVEKRPGAIDAGDPAPGRNPLRHGEARLAKSAAEIEYGLAWPEGQHRLAQVAV